MAQIMVINDDTAFLELMEELLSDEGYDTTIIKASDKAYGMVRKQQPDVVVLDMRVNQETSAWTVVDMLRLDPTTKHIPVILCSTDHRLFASKAEYLAQHNIDWLEKPFDLNELLRRLERIVGKP